MTDETNTDFELSRRKILGAAGTVGAAGALGGAATTSLLWDEEKFGTGNNPNVLQAGTLDLKVDWEEHYSDWSGDESKGLDNDVVMTDGDPNQVPEDYVGLPDPTDPLLAVHQDDLGEFMNNTSIESYPDPNDDGVQNDFGAGEVGTFCSDGADLPEDLDPNGLRSDNSDTRGENGPAPLVSLMDVKPGDFGELTLSLHLCDNPGYVWLQGDLVEARENGITEPEEASPDETGPEKEVSTDPETAEVELLDAIETTWWYDDNCNNVLDGNGNGATKADVVIVMDRSGSMYGEPLNKAKNGAKNLVDVLGSNDQVGLVSYSTNSTLDEGLTTSHGDVKTAIDGLSAGGGTNMEAGVEHGHEELLQGDQFVEAYPESGNARSDAEKILVFLSDGNENQKTDVTDDDNGSPVKEANNAKKAGIEIFTIGYGDGPDKATLKNMASDPTDDHFFTADTSEIEQTFSEIGGAVTSQEEVFFQGTLREALIELSDGFGIPLDGDRNTQFNETEDDPSSDKRDCYQSLDTDCIGVAWYLPRDLPGMVDNAIQTDAVAFNLGFYTEQCRHNDGSGTTDDVGNA